MSASNKARQRQKATDEKYLMALCHIRAECGKCKKGTPCSGCVIEPCWTCRPACPRVNQDGSDAKCKFDDLLPDGRKKCTYCENVWPQAVFSEASKQVPMRPLPVPLKTLPAVPLEPGQAEHWLKCHSPPGPVLPGDTRMEDIRPKGPPILVSVTRTGRSPTELYDLNQKAGKHVIRGKVSDPNYKVIDELDELLPVGEGFAKERVTKPCNALIPQKEDFDWVCNLPEGHAGPHRMVSH